MFNNPELEAKLLQVRETCEDAVKRILNAARGQEVVSYECLKEKGCKCHECETHLVHKKVSKARTDLKDYLDGKKM